jgi:hypothetical protein
MEERLQQLLQEIKLGEIIVYDPLTYIPYISGKGPKKTCGDCGKTNCLTLYNENEIGRLNHGVCHSCWCKRGLEECEGGLIGYPNDGPSNREIDLMIRLKIYK